MEELKVWKKIKWNQIPRGRRCIKHKWVFEIKRNGVFRARLVASIQGKISSLWIQSSAWG